MKSRIADRMRRIDASGIRKVFDLAVNMKNPVNLSIGQPDFDVPDLLKEEAIAAIRSGYNKYTQTQGIKPLIELIKHDLNEIYDYEPEELFVSSGVSGGLILALLVLLNPGDECLIPDPYFVMYKHLVNLCGAQPVFYDMYPHFEVTADAIEKALTEKTKVLILNSPSNPTSKIIKESELRKIAAIAKSRGLIVITDEIYDKLLYDTSRQSTIATMYDKVIYLNGFSKSCAMTGWRVGYVAGPAEILKEMIKLQQFSFVCAPSFTQQALLKLHDVDFSPYVDAYRKKRDLIYNGLKDFFHVEKPQGAFYIFPKAPGGNATEFVKQAIAKGLLIIPGNVFSERDTHFRISFAAADETIERGIEILRSLV